MKRICLLWLMICLLLTGCGEDNANPQQSEDISLRQSGDTPTETEQPKRESIQEAELLHVKKMETVEFAEVEEGYTEYSVSYKILGKKIYMLRIESTEEKYAARLCVQIYDTESAEIQQQLIVPRIPEHEDSSIFSADLTADMELSLKMWDIGSEDTYFLVRMNLEGDIIKVTDPFPDEDSYPWNKGFWNEIRVFDLSDGRTILGHGNAEEKTTRLTWYQEDTGAGEPVGTLDCSFVSSLILDEEGMFYYLGGDSLIRWDAKKNVSEDLFHLYENGINMVIEASGLILNEEGELLLCCIYSGEVKIYVLTDKENADGEKIQLCSLQGAAGVSYFQRLAATFTQNGGDIPIKMEMEERQEYQEDYRTRIMAEMVSGEGPDILYVSREDMVLMQEKGMLCDLSEMIAQETKAVMIPGVLELGTVNDELVGLVPEVSFITLGVSDKVWEENNWNMEELASLLASNNWEYPFDQIGIRPDGLSIFFGVFFRNPANSGFLDLEQGAAHFDCEAFTNILELCKKYGDEKSFEEKLKEQLSADERTRLLREGKTAVEILYLYGGLDAFSSVAERYGDEGHIVGFPVENGSGCYVDSYSYGYLVVNARTEYREEISKFFAWLLDYDNQFETSGGCVRTDVIRDSIYYERWMDTYVMLRTPASSNSPSYQNIGLKPDGTPYLEEYLAFVESCEPAPYCPQQISTIIGEELQPFFDGRKSAGDTADIIQSKVQLYLDEIR